MCSNFIFPQTTQPNEPQTRTLSHVHVTLLPNTDLIIDILQIQFSTQQAELNPDKYFSQVKST